MKSNFIKLITFVNIVTLERSGTKHIWQKYNKHDNNSNKEEIRISI